ncbi:MAG TPA: Crp/Fnr family transcriptional regulator [Pseudolabrys sp.]|nr:Crp/Fnr family transcriptional regulator [Pseudolabrys sp.]
MTINAAILRRTELFAKLDVPALEEVVRHGRTRRVPRGRIIFHRGDLATDCHLLLSGRIRIGQTDGGNDVVIRYVGPGQIFGALALFHGGRYPADATAVTDCVEIRWSSAAITELMQRYPRIALNALAIVGHRLDELQHRVRELTTETVDRRIAHALLRLAQHAGRRVKGGIEISFPLSRKDLAAMSGTAHTTVSRTLSDWQDKGIIMSGRRRIVVCDLRKLEALAESQPR